jgi:hypothetical protein
MRFVLLAPFGDLGCGLSSQPPGNPTAAGDPGTTNPLARRLNGCDVGHLGQTATSAAAESPSAPAEEETEYRRTARADATRIGQVLDGVEFPAAKWQLIAHADHYGADSVTRSELWALPVGVYPDLLSVLVATGMPARPAPSHTVPPPAAYRSQPGLQAAAQERPER